MATTQPKKLLILNLLDLLNRHTDAEHRLSQHEIGAILEREYGMKADRKTIKRNLLDLIDAGYALEYSETTRTNSRGEEETLLTDWYISHTFTDSELRLLIDGLLFSKHIPYSQCRGLCEKLEGLSSRHFRSHMGYIRTMPDTQPDNRQLFYTIEILDEAIRRGRQVAFHCLSYAADGRQHPRTGPDGQPREYRVNPYQMAAANGRYYLIANLDAYDNVIHFRLDRIADIRLLDTPAKDRALVYGLKQGLDLPRHMAEHLYLFSGENVSVTFRADKCILNDVMDWFSPVRLFNEQADTVDAAVTVNREAMLCWAMQYGRYVEVLTPTGLRRELCEAFCEAAEKYNREDTL